MTDDNSWNDGGAEAGAELAERAQDLAAMRAQTRAND